MTGISKREQAINSIEEDLVKNNAKKRKQDTRKKILLGAYLMSLMRQNPNLSEQVMRDLDKYLDKKIDRELFGLPPE
ncbi:MAG: mobilization protein [Waterburya sp.]